MKLNSLLLLDDISKQQVDAVSKKISIDHEKLTDYVKDIDPSTKYAPWVLKQIKFKNVRVPEDNYRIRETLNAFKKYQNNLELKDINSYKTIGDLERAIREVEGTGSKREGAFQVNPSKLDGVKKFDAEPYIIWEVSDPESLGIMGIGTNWCTREDYPECQSSMYIKEYGKIYIISKDNIPLIQFTPDLEQVMDVDDNITDIPVELDDKIIRILNIDRKLYEYRLRRRKLKQVPSESIIKSEDPSLMLQYAVEVIEDRWPEAEPYIVKHLRSSIQYVEHVLKDKWPEFEEEALRVLRKIETADFAQIKSKYPNISEDDWDNVVDNRIEKYIEYARVLKMRWLELEKYLLSNVTESVVKYAREVLKDRWLLAENAILSEKSEKAAIAAAIYAWRILKRRWPKAEKIILKYPKSASQYARYVLKGRWPEAEKIILKDNEAAIDYAGYVLKGRWPEAEKIILKDAIESALSPSIFTRSTLVDYAKYVLKGRWPEAEKIILGKDDPNLAFEYAVRIIEDRWPEAEHIISKSKEAWNEYASYWWFDDENI